jgi:hypothetical protein
VTYRQWAQVWELRLRPSESPTPEWVCQDLNPRLSVLSTSIAWGIAQPLVCHSSPTHTSSCPGILLGKAKEGLSARLQTLRPNPYSIREDQGGEGSQEPRMLVQIWAPRVGDLTWTSPLATSRVDVRSPDPHTRPPSPPLPSRICVITLLCLHCLVLEMWPMWLSSHHPCFVAEGTEAQSDSL